MPYNIVSCIHITSLELMIESKCLTPALQQTESYFDLLSCCDFKLWQRIRNESVDDATKGEKVTTNGSYHDDLFLNVERLIDCSCDVGTLF